jgi:hypothetical protein
MSTWRPVCRQNLNRTTAASANTPSSFQSFSWGKGKVSFPKIISGRSGGAARSSLSVASYQSVADTHGPHPGPEDSSVGPVIVAHHPQRV